MRLRRPRNQKIQAFAGIRLEKINIQILVSTIVKEIHVNQPMLYPQRLSMTHGCLIY